MQGVVEMRARGNVGKVQGRERIFDSVTKAQSRSRQAVGG